MMKNAIFIISIHHCAILINKINGRAGTTKRFLCRIAYALVD